MRGILLYSVRDASAQPWIRAGTTSQTLAPHGSRAGRREEHRSLLLVTLSAGPLAQDAATRRCCLGLPSARPSDLHPPQLSLIPESPPPLHTHLAGRPALFFCSAPLRRTAANSICILQLQLMNSLLYFLVLYLPARHTQAQYPCKAKRQCLLTLKVSSNTAFGFAGGQLPVAPLSDISRLTLVFFLRHNLKYLYTRHHN